MPLRAEERIIGVLNVYTKRRRRFKADEIALLATFADQASLAIEKDRLLQEARDHAIQMQALARLNQAVSASLDIGEVLRAITGAAAELTGAPAVAVWVADETRRVLELRAISDDRTAADFPTRTLRFDEGIAGWVASHSRPLDVPDVFRDSRTQAREWFKAHGFTSAHATPIVVHGTLLGVLVLFGTTPFRLRGLLRTRPPRPRADRQPHLSVLCLVARAAGVFAAATRGRWPARGRPADRTSRS